MPKLATATTLLLNSEMEIADGREKIRKEENNILGCMAKKDCYYYSSVVMGQLRYSSYPSQHATYG